MNLKYCAGICLVLVSLLFCQSCRKGCTNAKAFNYMSSAKQEDGSCLYCDSALTVGFGQSISIEDVTPGSPYQYNYVVYATVNSNYVVYNGNGCKLQGHDNTSGCSNVYYTAWLQNQTTSTITLSGTIQVYQFNSTAYFPVSNISIPPNGFANINLGSGGCQPQFSSFNVSIASPAFSYH